MTTPLTPHQILADIAALDRMAHDWLHEGRLDAVTEADLKAKKAELMDDLRQRFHTEEHEWWTGPGDRWVAWNGEPDGDYDDDAGRWMPTVKYAYGATEIEAIEQLLEMIGEDVDA
jgi:hypothetical protein